MFTKVNKRFRIDGCSQEVVSHSADLINQTFSRYIIWISERHEVDGDYTFNKNEDAS